MRSPRETQFFVRSHASFIVVFSTIKVVASRQRKSASTRSIPRPLFKSQLSPVRSPHRSRTLSRLFPTTSTLSPLSSPKFTVWELTRFRLGSLQRNAQTRDRRSQVRKPPPTGSTPRTPHRTSLAEKAPSLGRATYCRSHSHAPRQTTQTGI